MIAAFVLFWIVVGWALYDGEMYAGEATFWIVLWALSLAGFLFVPTISFYCVAAIAVVDIILLIKQFGGK